MMPYIKRSRRNGILNRKDLPGNAGELNYLITEEINKYLSKHQESYKTYNDIIGVLECAKLELYRRLVSPYEDIKIKENGDVY